MIIIKMIMHQIRLGDKIIPCHFIIPLYILCFLFTFFFIFHVLFYVSSLYLSISNLYFPIYKRLDQSKFDRSSLATVQAGAGKSNLTCQLPLNFLNAYLLIGIKRFPQYIHIYHLTRKNRPRHQRLRRWKSGIFLSAFA